MDIKMTPERIRAIAALKDALATCRTYQSSLQQGKVESDFARVQNSISDAIDPLAAPIDFKIPSPVATCKRELEADAAMIAAQDAIQKHKHQIAALRERVEGMKEKAHPDAGTRNTHNAACDQFLRILDEVIGRE